jgi:hypothetical protein
MVLPPKYCHPLGNGRGAGRGTVRCKTGFSTIIILKIIFNLNVDARLAMLVSVEEARGQTVEGGGN